MPFISTLTEIGKLHNLQRIMGFRCIYYSNLTIFHPVFPNSQTVQKHLSRSSVTNKMQIF